MISKDFQTAIVTRLSGDAYFTESSAIEVKAEQRGFSTKKAVQDALNNRGILTVISYAKKARDFRTTDNEYQVWCDVSTYENPKQNALSSGASRDGESVSGKAEALLRNYVIPISRADGESINPFGKLQIIPQPGSDGIGYLGERNEGIPVFGFRVQSNVSIGVEELCIGDPDSNFILVNENNQPFLISPTDP